MMKLTLAAIAASFLSVAAPAMAAPTIGDAMTCTSTFFTCSGSNTILDTGAEFTANLMKRPMLSFDFSPGLLTISNTSGSTFGFYGDAGFQFHDLNGAFDDATLVSETGFDGLSQANFSVANGVLAFNATSFNATSSDATLTLRLGSSGAVPEPGAWALMIVGLGAVGFAMRRQRAGEGRRPALRSARQSA